jgi:hypothetical protein
LPSITLPKVKTSFGSLTGTPRSIIFKRVNIDGLSVPVTHTLHGRYSGCSTPLADSVREGGKKSCRPHRRSPLRQESAVPRLRWPTQVELD